MRPHGVLHLKISLYPSGISRTLDSRRARIKFLVCRPSVFRCLRCICCLEIRQIITPPSIHHIADSPKSTLSPCIFDLRRRPTPFILLGVIRSNIGLGSYPYQDPHGTSVKRAHQCNLVSSFLYIVLINAQRVYPEESGLRAKSQKLKRTVQVRGNFALVAIAVDGKDICFPLVILVVEECCSLLSPYVGECLVRLM